MSTRRGRRLRFAAPLVLVVSCGQPPPAALPVEAPGMRDDGADAAVEVEPIDAAPVDAPVDAAVDAAPSGPQAGYVIFIVPAHTEQPSGYVSCHNFGPQNRGCNPPRPHRVPEERRRATLLTLGLISTGVRIQVAVPADATLPAKGGLIVREPARAGTPPAAHIVGRNDRTVVIEVTATREEVEAGLVLELADPDGVAWPALKAVTADVIDLQVIDGATVVTIDAGTGDGLDREWTGTFLNADGKPVPGGSFRLVWVGPNRARLKVKLTPDQVRAAGRVRLEPPPT